MATRWYQERKRDHFYNKAKQEGYRARSAYKLKQINNKYRILRPGDAVADLGCAPGGWSQVLVEEVGDAGLVIGVDLQRMRPIEGAKFIQGDFTHKITHDRLAGLLGQSGRRELDTVVSDMAPDMSGNYTIDQARSVQLCEMALRFAEAHLKDGGAFCCKIFEGADFQEFRDTLRSKFRRMYHHHPAASRKQSSEVYLMAKGYRRTTPLQELETEEE